jgi:hypothetical protein
MNVLPTLLLLAAVAALALPAGAEPVCVPGGPLAAINLACTIDEDDDGLPDAAVLGLPAEVQNDLGTFDLSPQARVVPDRDRDLVPEELMADVAGHGRTEDRDSGVHVGFEALDGDSAAGLELGTGYSTTSAGLGAEGEQVSLAGGLEALSSDHEVESSLGVDDPDGDGAPDRVPLALDLESPFDEEHARWTLPPV